MKVKILTGLVVFHLTAVSFVYAEKPEVNIGGLIEVGYEKVGDDPGNFKAGDIEVSIDAKLNENVSGNVLLRPDTPDEILDEVTITLENFSPAPISVTAGKTVMPFGVFETHLISDPWTKENELICWEINTVGVIGSYAHKMGEVAVALYDSSDLEDPSALAVQLSIMPTDGVTLGASFMSYYEDGEKEAFEYADLSGMVKVALGKVTIDGEYSGATKREEDMPRPSACSVGLAFHVSKPLELAVRYDGLSDDNENTISPESRIGAGFQLHPF
jgi:hypothetical protein